MTVVTDPAIPCSLAVGELEALLSSQNALIGKLKDECLSLGTKLETLTETSR
jgi:hypothetical protein